MLQRLPLYACIPAKDVARARRFYEDKLGFRPKEEVAGTGSNVLAAWSTTESPPRLRALAPTT